MVNGSKVKSWTDFDFECRHIGEELFLHWEGLLTSYPTSYMMYKDLDCLLWSLDAFNTSISRSIYLNDWSVLINQRRIRYGCRRNSSLIFPRSFTLDKQQMKYCHMVFFPVIFWLALITIMLCKRRVFANSYVCSFQHEPEL